MTTSGGTACKDLLRASAARLVESHRGGQGAARGASALQEALEPGAGCQLGARGETRPEAASAAEGTGESQAAGFQPWRPPWRTGGSPPTGVGASGLGSWVRRVKLDSPAVWGRAAGAPAGVRGPFLRSPVFGSHAGLQSAALTTGPQTRQDEGWSAGGVPVARALQSGIPIAASGGDVNSLQRGGESTQSAESREAGADCEAENGSPPWAQEAKDSRLARLYAEAVDAEGTPMQQPAWREVVGACARVANRMCTLVDQGHCREALLLFEPETLAKVDCHGATRCFDQAVVAASRLGDMRQVDSIMATMRQLRLRVGRVAHGSTISCIARERGPNAALEYLNRWVPSKEQTSIMYNTVLSSIVHEGRDKALFDACLAQMEGAGLRRDPKTWSLLAKRQALWRKDAQKSLPGQALSQAHQPDNPGDVFDASLGTLEALLASRKLPEAVEQLWSCLAAHRSLLQFWRPGTASDDEGDAPGTGGDASTLARIDGYSVQGYGSRKSQRFRALRMGKLTHKVMMAAERAGEPGLVQDIFLKAVQAGVQPTDYHFHSLLRCGGVWGEAALDVVSKMREVGLRIGAPTYGHLLLALAKDGDLQAAKTAFQTALAEGVQPDLFMYRNLLKAQRLDAHTPSGEWDPDAAMEVYHGLRAAALAPTAPIFRELFTGVAGMRHVKRDESATQAGKEASHQQGLRLGRARECLEEWAWDAQALDLLLDPDVLPKYLLALGQMNEPEKMLESLEAFLATGPQTSDAVKAYNAAIFALFRLENPREANDLANRMVSEGMQWDAYTYTSLIKGSLKTVQGVPAAKALFEEMLGRGIVPLVGTYHAMASTECALGSLNNAVKIVDSMEDAGITSLGRTCATLLESAERQGRHDISAVVRRKLDGETERLGDMLATHLAIKGTGFGGDSDDDMLGWT